MKVKLNFKKETVPVFLYFQILPRKPASNILKKTQIPRLKMAEKAPDVGKNVYLVGVRPRIIEPF